MTRYYNENPQVKHWMEKCAMLQQELDIINDDNKDEVETSAYWKEMCLKKQNEYNSLKAEYEGMTASRDSWMRICFEEKAKLKKYFNSYMDIKKLIKEFNSLPWYKKMFYKFR